MKFALKTVTQLKGESVGLFKIVCSKCLVRCFYCTQYNPPSDYLLPSPFASPNLGHSIT